MRKRVYQKIEIKCVSGQTKTFTERLRSDYQWATGFFFFINKARGTFSLRIANEEIIPTGTSIDLFAFQEGISRSEAMFDFSDSRVVAPNSLVELDLNCTNSGTIEVYILLENNEAD